MTKFSHALIASAALAFGGAASASNLVANGDFETGDLTGWVLSGDTSATGIDSGAGMSGAYAMSFGSTQSDAYLTQTLSVSSSAQYIVSFDLYNDAIGEGIEGGEGGDGIEDFALSFGGATLLSTSTGTSNISHYSFEVAGGNGVLQVSAMNQPGWWYLDNVSVTAAVPEASSTAMLLAGLGLMGAAARRRRSAR